MLGYSSKEHSPFHFMSRDQLKAKICATFAKHQSDITEVIEKNEWVCTTADIWGTKKRSFMGIAAHYIDSDSLERRSIALNCVEFPSPHSAERIVELLQLVYSTYNISSAKINGTVTDNAKNFQKAFNEFGSNYDKYVPFTEISDDGQSNKEDREEIQFAEIGNLTLADHFRCAAHKLNLVGSKDISEAQKVKSYKNIYVSAFRKLNLLWHKTSYPAANQIIHRILHCYINKPTLVRWNAVHDSVSKINSLIKSNSVGVDSVMIALHIETFTPAEKVFLEEYEKAMKPIAIALNNLQQTKCPYGVLLPSLFGVKSKMNTLLHDPSFKYCKPLVEAIIDGFNERFAEVMDFDNIKAIPGLIAAVIHPYFKMRWLKEYKTPENMQKIHNLFVRAIEDLNKNSKKNENIENDISFGNSNLK